MSRSRQQTKPQKPESGSWAAEGLPLAVRRQLLQRELRSLGFCRDDDPDGARQGGTAQQQPGPAAHPQAGGDSQHGD